MRKLSTYLKKAGISLMAAFTVFTNTNMGTLIAKAAEPQLNEGEELYQIAEGENTYTIREYTMDNSEVLFALRPETIYSADDQYETYADDGVGTYLDDNNITSEQQEAIKKIISIGYGTEPNAGNYIASQVLIWQVVTGSTYEVDANVAANMETVQTKIAEYDTDPAFVAQDITLEGYGEDHAVTLEDGSFTGYTEKEIPAGYHVEINDGSLKLWVDEGTEAGTLTFEKKSSEMKSILYKGTNGEFLSLGMGSKEIGVNVNVAVPEIVEESKDEKAEESEEAKPAKKAKAVKAAKAPVNNESVVAESVGDVRLVDISDVHVDYLKADNTTMTEGETFQTTVTSLSFNGRLEWTIPNSVDLRNVERVTYQLPKNVTLKDLSGNVTYKGDIVGTYEIDQNNTLYISYNDAFKEESNRAGWFKFETESMENKSEEQDLLFESGEEYSFRKKDPDPPAPVTPKIGIEKEYVRFKEGDALPFVSFNPSHSISSTHNADAIYTVSVHTRDGENNNVIVQDSYTTSRGSYYDIENTLIAFEITNGGETKLSLGPVFLLNGVPQFYDSAPQSFKDAEAWIGQNGDADGKYFFTTYGGYTFAAAIKSSDFHSKLPAIHFDHLNDGDVLKITYYTKNGSGSNNNVGHFGNTITNTATVVSDENPNFESNQAYGFPYSQRYLKQKDSITVYNNAYTLFDKTATAEDDTVHCQITVNGDLASDAHNSPSGNVNHFTNDFFGILAGVYDKATNFSISPSDDADYYLDRNSVKFEVSYLEFNSQSGVYERKTKFFKDFSGDRNTIDNFLLNRTPMITLLSSDQIYELQSNSYLLSPIITLSYDLKLNPSKVKYSSCEKIEYAGTNTLNVNSSDYFVTPDGNRITNFKRTVNYTNSLTPPSVEKTFYNIMPVNRNNREETDLVWDLDIYIPNTGITNLVVSDITSESFSFDSELNIADFENGLMILKDETSHENPIIPEITTNEEGNQVIKFKIDGKVVPDTGNHIILRLAFVPGDYTKDPHYEMFEDETPSEIHFTNNADIAADEIVNPCVKCPPCIEGECTKKVQTENAVNKSYKGYTDNTGNGGDLVITWGIDSTISRLLNDTDEITFEDFSPTSNFAFNDITFNNTVSVSSQEYTRFDVAKDHSTDFSDEILHVKFSDFFDITHDGNKTTLKVKPEYVSQIKGRQIKFDYVTTATKIASYTSMLYTNHVDMLVNGTKESEGEASWSIQAKKDNSFKKTAMTVNEFYNSENAFDRNFLESGLMTNYYPVDSDPKSNQNVVVWKMEVDISKLAIDENTQSLSIRDYIPSRWDTKDHTYLSGLPDYVDQNIFGVAAMVKKGGFSYSSPYFAPIKDMKLQKTGSYTGLTPYNLDMELNTYTSNPYLQATIMNGPYYSDLKTALSQADTICMYIFAEYVPANNLENKTINGKVYNTAELYIDNERTSISDASHDVTLEPSIEKKVVYDKSTAPYADYTVKITINKNYFIGNNSTYFNGRTYYGIPIFIEDLPSGKLEILPESVTFDLEVKSVMDIWEGTDIITYNDELDRWESNNGPWWDKGTDAQQGDNNHPIHISTENEKTSILFVLNTATALGRAQIAPGTTLTIKYKAKVNALEGTTLNERNEVSYQVATSKNKYSTSSNLSGSVVSASFAKSAFVLTDIFKKDAKTSTPLKDAEFRIDKLTLNEENTTVVKTETFGTPYITDEKGHTNTVKLNYDTVYRIVETKVPTGYLDSNKTTKYVVFPGHDNIDWSKVSVDGIDYIEVIDPTVIDKDNNVSQATVEVTNVKESSKKIVLTKKDDKGRILPNATFSLTGDDGSYTEYKSKEDGTLEIINLVRGVTYTLAEKEAPQFYNKNENVITFTVSDKGEITSPKIQKYNVEYDGGKGTVTDGDTTGDSINKEVDSGGNISLPEANAPEGYHFVGWTDENGNIVDNNTVVNQNMHVTAKYEHDTHTVTFRISDGVMSYREHINVTEFERIVPHGNTLQTMPSVNISGYEVTGWFDENGNEVTKDTVVDKDMVLTARFSPLILQLGPEFASNLNSSIKKVVFGKKSKYESVIADVEPVNVDVNHEGAIQAYTVGDTMYVLSDKTIFFNEDSSHMFHNSNCSLTSIVLDNVETKNVSTMESMFEGQDDLYSLDLSTIDTRNVTSMASMFKDCFSLRNIDLSKFNTDKVTAMDGMFNNCVNVRSLDFSKFNTSSVTTMSEMFKDCSALTDLDLSNFDTSNVVDMDNMFFRCTGLRSLDLSGFDTQNVSTMKEMFKNCSSLQILLIPNFSTINAPVRTNMFSGTNALSRILLGENWTAVSDSGISDKNLYHNGTTKPGTALMSEYIPSNAGLWKVYTGTVPLGISSFADFEKQFDLNMKHIIFGDLDIYKDKVKNFQEFSSRYSGEYFYYDDETGNFYVLSNSVISFGNSCTKLFKDLNKLETITFENIDTSNVTSMAGMFEGCYALKALDLSSFNTSKVTNMSNMFLQCNALTSIDLSSFDTSKVTNMNAMFQNCSSLTNIDVSNFNTSNVTNMTSMFHGTGLTQLDVSNFDTSKVTNMNDMFGWSKNLTVLDLSSFDTSKVTDMSSMFVSCENLANINLSSFDTSKVTNMQTMFRWCSNLQTLDISNFNTSKVTNMQMMFAGCGISNIDLSNFDTSNVTNMSNMFSSCKNLKDIDVSNFITSKVTDMSSMFNSCGVTSLNLSNFDTRKVTKMEAMFGGCDNLTSLNLSSFNTSNVTSMRLMFSGCKNLKNIDLSSFETSKVTDISYMFNECNNLVALDLSNFNLNKVSSSKVYATFKNCNSIQTAYARTQADANKLNSSSGKPTTWSFVVKP